MDLSLQPSSHSTPRKLRRYMGLLMNAEPELRSAGLNVADAYRFAIREHDRLESLRRSETQEFTPAAYGQVAEEVERELHQRLGHAVQLIKSFPQLAELWSEFHTYHSLWTQDRERTPAPGEIPSILDLIEDAALGPDTLGLPWDQLLSLHARVSSAALPDEFVGPYMIFLLGLSYGWNRPAPNPASAEDQNLQAAAQSLHDAVEFGLQEHAQALLPSSSGLPGDTEFQCLFMGVAFVQKNHAEPVAAWLGQKHYQTRLLRLLFAMGYLAAHDRQARRLTIKFAARLPGLVQDSFGKEARAVIERFQGET